jgi:hypothetical protein
MWADAAHRVQDSAVIPVENDTLVGQKRPFTLRQVVVSRAHRSILPRSVYVAVGERRQEEYSLRGQQYNQSQTRFVMNRFQGVVSGLGMVIALAGMQSQERGAPTPTPQTNRSTNLNSSRSNRTVEPDAKPTPTSEEERAKGDTSKPVIQNIKARSGQPSPSPTFGGRRAATITSTPGPQDATNLNSSKSNRQAQLTPTARPQ